MPKNILIVDDSPAMRNMVKLAMKRMYRFDQYFEAVDGLDALELLSLHPIFLIVCDINMPNMNGLELLERIKKDEHFQTIPVIMLTTEGRESDKERALQHGANAYVVKPFKPHIFRQAVRQVIQEEESDYE